jgi:hypothetical protein
MMKKEKAPGGDTRGLDGPSLAGNQSEATANDKARTVPTETYAATTPFARGTPVFLRLALVRRAEVSRPSGFSGCETARAVAIEGSGLPTFWA